MYVISRAGSFAQYFALPRAYKALGALARTLKFRRVSVWGELATQKDDNCLHDSPSKKGQLNQILRCV